MRPLVADRLSLLTLALNFLGALSLQIWSSPGALPTNIPAGCRAALSQNITCSPDLVSAQFVANGRALTGDSVTEYCTSSCYNSLKLFQTNVDTRCGNTLYKMFINSTLQQSGASIADPLAWAYNVTCLQDETGFCLAALYNGTKDTCSDCALKYGAAMLSSDYGRIRVQPDAFSSLISSCGVPASKYLYTYTTTSSVTPTATTTSAPATGCTGTQYTVGASDTCQSISAANSIAIDRLISANALDYNCSTLTPGTTLCLGPSCALQTVQPNHTCQDFIANQPFGLAQLVSWNPTIHANCDNLDAMVGRSICISPPGTSKFEITTLSTATPTISSMFSGPFIAGSVVTNPPNITTSWYNTQTTFIDPTTTTVVVNLTAKSLMAERTAYCPITDQDYDNGFTEADLPDACQSLLMPYCHPDPDAPIPTSMRFPAVCTPVRDTDTASMTSSAANSIPSPLEPNTIATCQQYYRILDGDTCYSIATHFEITLDQFNAWNPYVGTDCSQLWLGYYVCLKA